MGSNPTLSATPSREHKTCGKHQIGTHQNTHLGASLAGNLFQILRGVGVTMAELGAREEIFQEDASLAQA